MNRDSRNRLLLIDGHSMAFRAFYALPVENFATSTGEPTNAVYGFTSMLINLLRDEEPTHIAVAFDVGHLTFRNEQYDQYKGTREETPEAFRGQIPLIKAVLDALDIVWLEKADYEADDIIATLARTGEESGSEVLVCSGDRDTLQLVTDHVTVLYPKKGVSELARMTPAAVQEKYGVNPENYPDIAALVGETSDNLPGVPGVGPKTAAKWVNAYGDTDGVLAAAGSIGGKVGENLRQHVDQVRLNRRLNALVRTLDLGVDFDDLVRRRYHRERVHDVFDALQFRTLRERLFQVVPDDTEALPAVAAVSGQRVEPGGVALWLDAHRDGPFGLDVVGQFAKGIGDAWLVSIADSDRGALAIDLDAATEQDLVALRSWLGDPDRPKAVHDMKFAEHALAGRGHALAGVRVDTALAAYLCRPDQRHYDLSDVAVRYLGREIVGASSAAGQGELALDDGRDAQESWTRAATVAEAAEVLEAELATRGASELLRDLEIPVAHVLAKMESAGIAADVPYLTDLDEDFGARAEQLAQAAYDVIGRTVNLGSPKQLQEILFDQLGMPKTKRIKTGYTTDAEALADLYVKTEHPFLEHVLAHRDVTKLRQTVQGLLRSVADDGRIHTTFQQTIAATGRLSSADPNLQNIPTRTDEGRRIREAFVVGSDYEMLMTADYSQIEMRIMAHLSNDAGLIEAFRSGEDLHSFVGARVFGVEPEDVSPAMRAKVKAMSYGLAYGLSAFGLSRQLGIDPAEARALMADYFTRFGGVRDYLASVVDEARRTGYTETIRGRRRYLPDLTSDNRQRRDMAERMALNAPIQGSAADIVKEAMIRFDARLVEGSLSSRLLSQVHDELIVEVAPGESAEVEAALRESMASAAQLSVPLDISVGRGRSWREAAH